MEPQIQAPVTQVEKPIVPSSAPKRTLFMLLAMIVVLLGTTSYLAFQNYQLKKFIGKPSASPFPTSSPIADITADWETFKNDVYEFKYPVFLPKITKRNKEFESPTSPDIYESSYLDPNQKGGGPGYTVLLRVIGPQFNPKELTLEKWIENQNLNSDGYGDQLTRSLKTVIVDSQPAILQTGVVTGFTIPTEFNLYIAIDKNVYTISYSLQVNEEEAKKYQTDFDQILSTFKFINIPSDDISTWETYISPLNEYTFKHPAGIKSDTEGGGTGIESIRYSYMGQKQIASGRTEGELGDGYAFFVSKANGLSNTTVDTLVTQSHQSNVDICPSPTNVGDISSTTVNGTAAKKFTTTNCYGNTTQYFLSNGKNIFVISLVYVGETTDLPGYKKTVEKIFSTLKFVN